MSDFQIKRLSVGQMEANCYLIRSTEGDCTIVDPGDDADYIIQAIQEDDLKPRAIIATHGHFDHVMAVLELKLAYRIPFYMHKGDEFLLERIESTAKHFAGFDPGPPPQVDFYLKDKAELIINSGRNASRLKLRIIHTPGHTPGSVCLYLENKDAIFIGDLMFAGGYTGRTDFSYSDKNDLITSLNKIAALPEATTVYPGHGESFLLSSRGS